MELNKNDSSSVQSSEVETVSSEVSQVSASKSQSDKSGSSGKSFKVLVVVLLIALIGVGAFAATRILSSGDGKIAYASEAVVLTTEEDVQAAMEEAMAQMYDSAVALSYKNDAYSEDGRNFECYIANSEANARDMFIAIYSDPALQEGQLYVSGLVRPGQGFERITLNRSLEKGDHKLYVAVTQVAEEDGQQVIKNQVVHTINFHVS